MQLSEAEILEYAKKIFGFAYSKTNDFTEAEDLSQEILTVLCQKSVSGEEIEIIDSYIYRVCFYTWSKYLRKNKPHWNAVNNEFTLEHLFFEDKTDEKLIEQELYNKLRQEIVYLSHLRREIIIRFYYDNQSGDEIAKALNIPASTLRWHLRQAKFELKERIEMTENTGIYKPVHLVIGHCGWTSDYGMSGLQKDTLTQNICYVCYGKAKTVEEIARTLGVAAIYLEDKLENMLHMDYMKKVGSNKYQTNFFIEDREYIIAKGEYQQKYVPELSKMYYDTVKNAMGDIKSIGFMGSDMPEDELIWNILPYFITVKTGQLDEQVIRELELNHECPLRKDGTKHWVYASNNTVIREDTELADFLRKSGCCGIKSRSADTLNSLQYDQNIFGDWRDFECEDLNQLTRVAAIIKSGEKPNDFDKGIIAKLVQKGYVFVRDEDIKILIPYLTNAEQVKLSEILNQSAEKYFDESRAFEIFKGYAELIDKYIPKFIDKNERNHLMTSFNPQSVIVYCLYRDKYLKAPTEEEKKRFCTIVWEN